MNTTPESPEPTPDTLPPTPDTRHASPDTRHATPDTLPPSPGHYRRILFCTDFSENAEHAFRFAVDAAHRRPGCILHLLHVIPEPEAQFWKTYIYEVDGIDEKAKRDIDAKIDADYRPLVPKGVDFRVEIRVGRDYIRILEFADQQDVDLIVLGRHGHTAFGKWLFGNVAEKVARHAPCPVMIVPLERGG